jgi:hypothetical protein
MGWSVNELYSFLEREGIPRTAYSIGTDQDESYCLVPQGDEWLVYYSERGNRNELGWGKTEEQGLNLLKLFVLEGVRGVRRTQP